MNLRPWQAEALKKCLSWFLHGSKQKHFLINAAPGAGKTIAACVIARELLNKKIVSRVIVIAPRTEVVRQWARDFKDVTSFFMGPITSAQKEVIGQFHMCATWNAVQGLQDAFHAVCKSENTLVICDEHHHAAVKAAWGDSAESAFAAAKHVIVLTGTPIRSDGEKNIWFAYDDNGRIEHPDEGTYTLTYGDAVDLEYCRPVTFHRHEGKFSIDLDDGIKVHVSGAQPLPPSKIVKIPQLQRALHFFKLACQPQYLKDKKTPNPDGYQGTMFEWANSKLDDLRMRMPNAGGLIIAPNVELAEYFKALVETMDGETPSIVHSHKEGSENVIEAFRNSGKKWIVSVAMITEGVDIKRLRVLLYLPGAVTELAFRQAIGRVVRTSGPEDDTRAYVVMPAFDRLESYARRIEEEMPAKARAPEEKPKKKICYSCKGENELTARFCVHCQFEFPESKKKFKPCSSCGELNVSTADACAFCGTSFIPEYDLRLEDALRVGVIVRGMDISEEETVRAEKMAPVFYSQIIKTGDANLMKMIRTFPVESLARIIRIARGIDLGDVE